jgi:hypothetical protein
MIVIRHEFSERSTGYRYPVVAHEFAGETLEEARSMFHAHMQYDRMLRAVAGLGHGSNGATGQWNGIDYRSTIRVLSR